MYFYLKALHIIFVVTWFAGLFYIVRLFIYHTEANELEETKKEILQNQFKIMEKRLWYGITWPSCVLTILFGLSLFHNFFPLTDHPWLIVKLCFVFGLFLYHLSCGYILKNLQCNKFPLSSTKLRVWNEVATIFLVAIVFLVVLKDVLSMANGIIGLIIFTGALMLGIKGYKKLRG
ncbi:TIGR00701 family protein [Bacteriovorax sp. BSW11_IV]|uniref:CopD family protein n=1 Tax=Bacteriovorax sp. BSW11_IV TaxID=1353529 RepID=UPI00038A2EE0|nr:CopD family protein [Bacteriovorax sp. BSW11_IV]EQC49580.1 TIGR00701 family protein [Bacteriovorax sp. BSW11_IV]